MRAWLLASIPVFCSLGCDSSPSPCTEIGCTDTADVQYQASFSGPYDLHLDIDGTSLDLRCLDPDSPEAAENPPEAACNAAGFSLEGEIAQSSTVFVTVVDVQTGELLTPPSTVVDLALPPDGSGEDTPNGPDCPPTCYHRFGNLVY